MIRLLLLLSFVYSLENQSFEIKFWGIPSAEAKIEVSDIYHDHKKAKSIVFQTNSINFTKYIFNVDNYYQTLTSDDLKTILSFNKKTSQPNVINNIQTFTSNNEVFYDNSSILIPKNTFNIFSLLYFMSKNKITNSKSINIEREGILYYGTIIPIEISDNNIITYQLNLEENYTPFNIPAIKNTDIFTWALFKKNSEKYITIDYNKNEIIECIFKSGIVRMHAKNINYNH